MGFVLLTGGVRAGKSHLAESMARASGRPVTVVATGEALDEEMARRIEVHRRRRPPEWRVIEEPVELARAVEVVEPGEGVIIDCLTLWVTNLLDHADPVVEADRVAGMLADRSGPGWVVTNEVGWGIIPDNPIARRFGDLLGGVNTAFAARSDHAYLVVAGRGLRLTSLDHV